MKTKKTQDNWQGHIDGWRESGMSQRGYCRLHAINPWTFRSRLKKTETATEPFTEVCMKPRQPDIMRIDVKGRYTIELPVMTDGVVLERILRAIEAAE